MNRGRDLRPFGKGTETMVGASSWRPLAGLRVVDFSTLLPGPVATLVLADLGAEVIKVEPPGGDHARQMKGALFDGANRGKASLVLDLKSPEATEIVDRLARRADVVIEGFRPGVADRLGFGAERLRGLNPDLVYCSLSGFGQTGPAAARAGHDLAYLAMSGSLAYRGQWREPPRRSSLPVADMLGGAFAAIAIIAALREGKGRHLDLSLHESALFASLIRFGPNAPANTADHLYPANDLFLCGDGRMIALTVVEEKFWSNLVAATRDVAPALAAPQYATENGRASNAEALMAELDTMFAKAPAQHWIDRFALADVPAEICLTNAEALAAPQTRARGLCRETPAGPVVPFPVFADGASVEDTGPSPGLGEQSRAILNALGFSGSEIDRLGRSGALGAWGDDG